jgi:hypothetical protein
MPIDEALTELKAASAELYAAAQGGAPQDGAQPGADAATEDAEVTDVDFEEVK